MVPPPGRADAPERVLIFAPVGRDAALTEDLLRRGGVTGYVCPTMADLCEALADGAGAVLLTEEVLHDPEVGRLIATLEEQPPWSDISTLLFAGSHIQEPALRTLRALEAMRNVTLLDRPVRLAAVLSAVRAALRSRRRQYEVRDLLVALHRARTDAENANRLKDEFLSTLSHELRTPLNAILGWTTMLRHGQVPPARLPHVFEVLERNAQAQAQLIADVLDVSRIVTGKLHLQMEPLDIGVVLAGAVDGVRPAALTRHVDLRIDLEPELVVLGDPARLQQVFWNLLTNAVKFTPPGGAVTVTASRIGDSVELAVTDTGVGIDPAFLPYVFDRFRQGDQSTTRAYGGLGLGLAIVRHLVELHGGTVAATSEGLNHGATFVVTLPTHAEPRAARPVALRRDAAETPREFSLSFAGTTVLVVDDDASTRELLQSVVSGSGAQVLLADSVERAFELLAARPPDVVIADLGMPNEDGFSLVQRMRASDSAWRDIPALALSAYADARSEERARAAGFTQFLGKPVLPQDVLHAIEQLLSQRA